MSNRSIAVARSYRGGATRPASFCRAPLRRAAGSGIGSTFVGTSFSRGIGKGPAVVSNIIGQERHDLWLAGGGDPLLAGKSGFTANRLTRPQQ